MTGNAAVDRRWYGYGPAAQLSPTRSDSGVLAEMRSGPLPAAVVPHAGPFVWGHQRLLCPDRQWKNGVRRHPIPKERAVFLHIPFPYAQKQVARVGNAPSMALDDIGAASRRPWPHAVLTEITLRTTA